MPRAVTLTLPDDLAAQAERLGLLTSDAYENWLREEVRRRAWDRLSDAMQRLAAVDEPPLTDEELEAEVAAARAERGARRARGD
jgi:hypothetical protein